MAASCTIWSTVRYRPPIADGILPMILFDGATRASIFCRSAFVCRELRQRRREDHVIVLPKSAPEKLGETVLICIEDRNRWLAGVPLNPAAERPGRELRSPAPDAILDPSPKVAVRRERPQVSGRDHLIALPKSVAEKVPVVVKLTCMSIVIPRGFITTRASILRWKLRIGENAASGTGRGIT